MKPELKKYRVVVVVELWDPAPVAPLTNIAFEVREALVEWGATPFTDAAVLEVEPYAPD